MRITIKEHDRVSIIWLKGDFLSEVDQNEVRQKVSGLIAKGRKQIVIDLSNVKHINSCGLGLLVCALTAVKKVNGELRLAGIDAAVAELLKITHLDTIFQVNKTASAALLDFRLLEN